MKRAQKPFLILWIRSSFFKRLPKICAQARKARPRAACLSLARQARARRSTRPAQAASTQNLTGRQAGAGAQCPAGPKSACPQSPPRARAARETCASHKARSTAAPAARRKRRPGRGIKQPGGPIGVFHEAFSSRSMKPCRPCAARQAVGKSLSAQAEKARRNRPRRKAGKQRKARLRLAVHPDSPAFAPRGQALTAKL